MKKIIPLYLITTTYTNAQQHECDCSFSFLFPYSPNVVVNVRISLRWPDSQTPYDFICYPFDLQNALFHMNMLLSAPPVAKKSPFLEKDTIFISAL